ncbi:hypothetical protein ANCDUO_03195 [Ancylostoma duodenale]|uniref:Uncharacterized protein n=1 Tax=Ancylostoma duodenale TaxID=51022 RepID=A0A0C2D9P6_9BILA|nr:hypothetical protein ANCDUO_03195 [Ancylostoma duodenale]
MSPVARRFPFRVKLDTLSSVANDSPNTSSRLQFVQPLQPFYHPDEPLLQFFKETDKRYDSLFQFVWSVEMCLMMVSESATSIGQVAARKGKVNQWFRRLRYWIDKAIDYDAIVDAHWKYLDGLSASFFLTSDTEIALVVHTSLMTRVSQEVTVLSGGKACGRVGGGVS